MNEKCFTRKKRDASWRKFVIADSQVTKRCYELRHGLGRSRSSRFNTSLYLWGRLEDKMYKTNSCTLKRLRNNIAVRYQRFWGRTQVSKRTSPACIKGASGQEADILSICCSTGETLVDLITVVMTAIFFTLPPETGRVT
jgi:hypothetical protein